ncbi:YigZ family protein [Thalassotalea sp. LPB0316]|uniref:YigZ family protein n=1 Tax=Thalassotalea sp. LPB0316 TaxID=2769490 RepID=UPI0018661B4F|nr:YigZ family protein [Thalassotalea sp. LPB0316]QOL26401.1 YigZ family protein [Thalassotalea sp. LPB0316]
MNNSTYEVAINEVELETVVNRSRFICYLFPCTSPTEFKVRLSACQHEHPNASHHCYAFLLGSPTDSQNYGFSDDGEPSGTAGRPMLASLQGGGVGEVAAIVVRYFGGTKLGTGGLSRAYSLSVRNALEKLKSKTKIPMVQRQLTCQYTQVNDVFYLLEQHQGQLIEQHFDEHVNLTIELPLAQVDRFTNQLETMSSGKLVLTSEEE